MRFCERLSTCAHVQLLIQYSFSTMRVQCTIFTTRPIVEAEVAYAALMCSLIVRRQVVLHAVLDLEQQARKKVISALRRNIYVR